MQQVKNNFKFLLAPEGFLAGDTPYEWYKTMRAESPVTYDPDREVWNLFAYDDCQRALMDYKTFSSQFTDESNKKRMSMIAQDPPQHKKYRNLAQQAFTQEAVDALAPKIEAITRELLDNVQASGHMDVIADLSYPLPVRVIAEMLGIPLDDHEKFKHWSDTMVRRVDHESGETIEQLLNIRIQNRQEMHEYFQWIIEERRHNPGEDMISALHAATIDGQSLTSEEMLSLCELLLIAGHETTTNLIGNAITCFTEFPHVLEQVRNDLSLIPDAIEETLRFRCPVQGLRRIAVQDVEMGGQLIRAGEIVTPWIASANHDESKFEHADQFRLDRRLNPHLGFGHGVHLCLGAPLARLEGKIALTEMIKRMPNMRLAEGTRLQTSKSVTIYGYTAVPIVF